MAVRKVGDAPGNGRSGALMGRATDTGRFEVKEAGRKPKTTVTERMPASGRGDSGVLRWIGSDGKTYERAVSRIDMEKLDQPIVMQARKAVIVTRAKLKQSGGSLIFTVPAPARKAMDFKPGDEIELTVDDDGRMIVEPAPAPRKRPKYSLEELLAQCDPDAPISDEERAWLDEPAVGREAW
jgi:antitoxin ChpS